MRKLDCIGVALEVTGPEVREKPCYGTYLGDMPDQSFRFNVSIVEHTTAFRMHSHEYSELVIVLGGRGLHLTSFENHPLEEGDIFVINGGTRHGFQDPQHLRLCNIMYDPKQFLLGHRDLQKLVGFNVLFALQPRSRCSHHFKERLHLSTEEMIHVRNLVSSLKTEFDGRMEGRRTLIQNLFLMLVTYLSRVYSDQKRNTATPLVRMAKVISYIQDHYEEPVRIEDLAKVAHLSSSQLQRLFRKIYKTTPHRFIHQVRMHEACEMLKDPNRDITEVAFSTGFSSSAFFSAQFKRYMGESPSQYRRKKLAEMDRHAHEGLGEPLAQTEYRTHPTGSRPSPNAAIGRDRLCA